MALDQQQLQGYAVRLRTEGFVEIPEDEITMTVETIAIVCGFAQIEAYEVEVKSVALFDNFDFDGTALRLERAIAVRR